MKLSWQITLGYMVMLLLMLVISGFSIYGMYKLNRASANIKGRYETISSLISDKAREGVQPEVFTFDNQMLAESIKISETQSKYALATTMTVVAMTLLFGGVLTLVLPRMITRPISQLVRTAYLVSKGDYSRRAELSNVSGEIADLIRTFNVMLDRIEWNTSELEKKNEENLRLLEATRRFNETLEAKIEEVTREIENKQEELLRSERLATIGELATGIAHEIKNPLSGIYLALEMMMKEIDNPDHRQTIADILAEINRLDRIIKELLQLGAPRSLSPLQCSPNEIVERSLDLVTLKCREKGIHIVKDLRCRRDFYVDAEQIEQVVINLLLNALDASDEGGTIRVETLEEGDDVVIRVSDNGCGIPEEDVDKIFKPFYSTKEHGTGLGLSISTRIVESHGGRLELEKSQGEGAVFAVVLPAGESNPERRNTA